MAKRVKALKRKVNFDDSSYDYEFYMYDVGEENLSEENKEIIREAYALRDEVHIIDDIFRISQSKGLKAKEIFNFMIQEGMVEDTNYEKSTDGPKYTKIFEHCRGHYGENPSKRCGGYTCYVCKRTNLGRCMEGFAHCCCFRLKT